MPTPVPIDPGGEGTCNECDLCCVLNVVEKDGCFNLFWQCNCPGGTLVMQWFNSFTGWNDLAGWVQTGPNYWYPWNNVRAINGPFRLKCTLDSGEVFYSNQVGLTPTSSWNRYQCSDTPGDVKTFGAEVDYSVQPYTASGAYPGVISWGTEVDYTAGVIGSGSGIVPTTLYTFAAGDYVDASFFYQQSATGEIICVVRYFAGGVQLGQSEGRRDIADLTQGWRCYDNCPSFDEFLSVPTDYYFCSAFSGTPPNTYCSNGVKFRVKEIRIVTS